MDKKIEIEKALARAGIILHESVTINLVRLWDSETCEYSEEVALIAGKEVSDFGYEYEKVKP